MSIKTYHIVFLLTSFFSFGQSVNSATTKSIKANFTTASVKAYQESATLKVEDFYNYLNTVRIDYITKELRDNPQLLKYKIAAISDMCGYSSHGQFTTNFRAKTGISPSQYISFLTKELKSQ